LPGGLVRDVRPNGAGRVARWITI